MDLFECSIRVVLIALLEYTNLQVLEFIDHIRNKSSGRKVAYTCKYIVPMDIQSLLQAWLLSEAGITSITQGL